jgi:hypothetical protein
MSSRRLVEFLFSAAIVIFLGWVLWEPKDWPAPARLFPWSLGLSVLALALIQFVVSGRALLAERKTAARTNSKHEWTSEPVTAAGPSFGAGACAPSDHEPAHRRVMTIVVCLVAFFLGLCLVGFNVGSLLLTFAFLKFTAKEKWSVSAAMAVGTYLFFWLIFDLGLKLPLGNGLLADYFPGD